MIDKYEEIFKRYKNFIESNSQYNTRVVKHNTNTSSHFPLVTCELSNSIDTDHCTNFKIEYYEQEYFTINIYTKNKIITTEEETPTNVEVSSEVVNNEITKLTIKFFDELNMKRTLCKIIPNIDQSILRRTLQYQCLIGNVRGNIIRR